ncbi:hypothetical protein CDD82_1351 [Ophiocordyceps australis]|uniref:Protein transport protein sec16 n=1 Tax=Ophiocordyceps australis TaxID=1399860 RepID=A0A2C5ZQP5_9HYPO|nr:hypothetical protein CDD82_1351 [Ophiocordyceps australis]
MASRPPGSSWNPALMPGSDISPDLDYTTSEREPVESAIPAPEPPVHVEELNHSPQDAPSSASPDPFLSNAVVNQAEEQEPIVQNSPNQDHQFQPLDEQVNVDAQTTHSYEQDEFNGASGADPEAVEALFEQSAAHPSAEEHNQDGELATMSSTTLEDDRTGSNASKTVSNTADIETEWGMEGTEKIADDGIPSHPETTGIAHGQHSSSLSFARTVSHQVSFIDEEETDWTLPHPGPDVSTFLPPSAERSNFFPPVPPVQSTDSKSEHQPLPSTQASDILGTISNYDDAESQDLAPDTQQEGFWQSIGGEVQSFEAQASEARYEEGIPLISHESEVMEQEPMEQESMESGDGDLGDPFAGDGENEDDFFSQMHQPAQPQTEERREPLERKSTMQVIGTTTPEPVSRQNTLGSTVEEQDEDPGVQSQQNDDAANNDYLSALKDEQGHAEALPSEDIESKWQQAFAGDDEDEFLFDEPATEHQDVDPAAFLGSDDEGLLDDDADEAVPEPQPVPPAPANQHASVPSRYTPVSLPAQQTSSPYVPQGTTPTQPSVIQQGPFSSALYAPSQYGQAPAPRPQPSSTQSFVDKAKGGYSSPYDLPSDLMPTTVQPRKRASMIQLPNEPTAHPPRSTNMYSPAQNAPFSAAPAQAPVAAPVPAPAPGATAQRPPPTHTSSTPTMHSQSSFFQELPVSSKPRQGAKTAGPQSPAVASPPPQSNYALPGAPHQTSVSPYAAVGNLVQPERVSPYAPLQHPSSGPAPMQAPGPAPPGNTRYSSAPAQAQLQQTAPAPTSSRYSPVPAGPRPGSSSGPASNPPQPALPHLPRTSSPLAQFETSINNPDRRSSASFEPRLSRVASLPPTHEVDEDEENGASQAYPVSNNASRFSPASVPSVARQTPPLVSSKPGPPAPSPPKRSTTNYAPQAAPATQPGFVPPPRPSTQSPGTTRSNQGYRPSDHGARPSSAHSMAPRTHHVPMSQQVYGASAGARSNPLSTHSANLVPPTDGREHDPLQRWKGVPLIAWGVGGTVITSFPKSSPRYSVAQTAPVVLRTPGEVRVQNIREIDALSEQHVKFPGPLKGKSKKKEALAWLSAGIDAQEKEIPDVTFHSQLSLEAKRGVERLLLWRLLRIFIEFDGALEGSSAVEQAVRGVLSPAVTSPMAENDGLYYAAATFAPKTGSTNVAYADAADGSAVEKMRNSLLRGDRESAVWAAVDKRLWGHAMLISHTVSPDLYKRVAQEFVRKEVNYPGHSNESMAALYKVLSGNFDDCVDELVPIHARAGLQLVSKEASSGSTKDVMDGLDKWRETLTLILSNRSTDDVRGLNALGKLLASYGRAEAAQICFIFSRTQSVFGGLDDGDADFVLVGSDHRQQPDGFFKETEALQLSEMYEYGLSLAGGAAASAGAPHLAGYKLQHAITLAEYGYRDKALQYCDSISAAIVSQTRRSPYHHVVLQAAVDDFSKRLKQAPKDGSSSWMSKPSMGKVSDSMWNRFNKFVAGDEGGEGSAGGMHDAGNGPFARIAATPSMSRSPSASNFDNFSTTSPIYGASAPVSASAHAPVMTSRYAPASGQAAVAPNPYAPVSEYAPGPAASYAPAQYPAAAASLGPSINDVPRNSYAPTHPGTSQSPAVGHGGYVPPTYSPQASGYHPVSQVVSPAVTAQHHAHQPPHSRDFQPSALQASPIIYPMDNSMVAGTSMENMPSSVAAANDQGYAKETTSSHGGYVPPSYQPYGYEPPSYQPEPETTSDETQDGPQAKKKSFMDDDDHLPALRPQGNSKPDQNREHDELFRKAVEEDEKRAAAQQANKKGWGFTGWFKGAKKNEANIGEATANKPIRAKLGDESSFVYDPDLKRWVNKKPGAENTEAKKSTPPPPKAVLRSASSTLAPSVSEMMSSGGRASAPPRAPPPHASEESAQKPPDLNVGAGTPSMSRQASSSGPMAHLASEPPSRPGTSMSNASSIDDLLGAAGPRKSGPKKPRKSGRYVDVMAK